MKIEESRYEYYYKNHDSFFNDFYIDNAIINNVNIWPLLKFIVYWKLWDEHCSNINTKKLKSTVKVKSNDNINILKKLTSLFKKNDPISCLEKSNVFFISYSNNQQIKNKVFNIYIDPITDYCKINKIKFFEFEISLNAKSGNPDKINFFELTSQQTTTEKEITDFPDWLDKYYQKLINFKIDITIDELKYRINNFFKNSSILNSYFKKYKGNYIFTYSYYGDFGLSIVKAAKDCNKKIIELQHRGISKINFEYNWKEISLIGDYLIPDYFWVWDKTSFNAIKEWDKKETKLIAGGSFWLNHYNKYFSKNKTTRFKKNIGKKVLFALQNIIPDSFVFETIKSFKDIHFIFRLHPRHEYIKENIIDKIQFIENCEIDNSPTDKFYDLLSEIDFVITYNSGVVIDGLFFGKKGIVLDDLGEKLYKDYIENNLIFVAKNQIELTEVLNITENNLHSPISTFNPEVTFNNLLNSK